MSGPIDVTDMTIAEFTTAVTSTSEPVEFSVAFSANVAGHVFDYLRHSAGLTQRGGREPAWSDDDGVAVLLGIMLAKGANAMAQAVRDPREFSPWPPESREAALEKRRQRQAKHDSGSAGVIESARKAGLSWRATARQLTDAGIPPPRRGRARARGKPAPWHPEQARRIAQRLGIE